MTNLTQEVGVITPTTALSELVIVGVNSEITEVYSIRPNSEIPVIYQAYRIEEFPYAMGSGANKFYEEYQKEFRDGLSRDDLVQLPIKIFDRHFIQLESDPHTGGEMQMLTISNAGVFRFIPVRWSEEEGNYTRKYFGQDILGKAIGSARIASSIWQLDDC